MASYANSKGGIKTLIGALLIGLIIACVFALAGCESTTAGVQVTQTTENGAQYSVQTYSGTSKEVVIDENYNNGKIVNIGKNAFRGQDITSVSLPKSLTSISESAFEGCTDLTEVVVNGKSQKVIFNNTIKGLNEVEIGTNAFKDTKILNLKIENSNDDDTVVNATISNIPSNVAKLVVKAYLNNSTDIGFESIVDIAGLRTKNTTLDFGTYGLFENIVVKTLDKDNHVLFEESFAGVAVTASHYNFGYLNASYPVLVYSLKLKEIAATGPTFTFLERNATYNWNNLPYGSQCMPFVTKSQATTGDFHSMREPTAAYIKSLYDLNNESTFNVYVTDNYGELVLQLLVANQIPEDNWDAYLLSDGSGTSWLLNQTYAVENPSQKHNTLVDEWLKIKNYTFVNGYNWATINSKITEGNGTRYSMLQKYAYVMNDAQTNIHWWVNRLRVGENLVPINEKDPVFASAIVASATSFYTNSLLAALTAEEANSFKALYKFSDEMFNVARDAGKDIMVILGTSWSGEAANFYNYVRLTMEFYGDDYVYYYKGHPGWPTSAYPAREEALTQLRNEGFTIYELECAIAAEVILFFNPDVYLAGWQSTTYVSVDSQTMACALFDTQKSDSYSGDLATYAPLMDMFISKMAANTSTYEGIVLDATHQYYLIQYNNGSSYANQVANYEKHEIAIYDANVKVVKYYHKGAGSDYVQVNADGTAIV